MVWGPTSCVGAELGSRRWFRWGVVVPECLSSASCDDGNECTSDACAAGSCSRTPLSAGTICSLGVCNGSSTDPRCVSCLDTSPTGTDVGCSSASPHCRTTGSGAPRCERCFDTTSGGLDLGCTATEPNCVAGTGGVFVCVACENDAQCADGDECTANACAAGSCTTSQLPFGAACSAGLCDVNGACSRLAVEVASPADGSRTSDSTPTYSGTATPGVTVTVRVDGVVVGTVVAGADGTWSLTPTVPLPEGAHVVLATVGGPGGATSADEASFEVDVSTTVSITAPTDGETTSDRTPEIRGTGEPGARVEVFIDGVRIGDVVVGADGSWVLEVETPLSNGSHTVEARAVDDLGNMARASSTFVVDARTHVDIESPASGATVSDATPTIRGTAAPGARVDVRIDGVLVGTVTADASGRWSLDVTDPLSDGSHTVEATATDTFGNVASDTSTFLVDTSTQVEITFADAMRVQGTGEPGATIVVRVDGRDRGTVVVAEDGTWSLTLDEPLGPGTHEVVVTASDAVGNTATDTERVVVEVSGVDAGLASDAGADAGSTLDASVPDAGSFQPAPVDAGADARTGERDAASTPGGFAGGACGCRVQGATSRASWCWMVVVGLVLAGAASRRSRRRR